MSIALSLDRFEGDDQTIAVLLDDEGRAANLPRHWLPKDAKAGDVLTLSIERDPEATRRLGERTRKLQDELRTRDPGGDITL